MKGCLAYLIILILVAWLMSCSKTKFQPACKKCIILSDKYNLEKVYLRTDTLYQDVLCGFELGRFKEAKEFWDNYGGFVVCDRDLYEKRIHIIN